MRCYCCGRYTDWWAARQEEVCPSCYPEYYQRNWQAITEIARGEDLRRP